MSKITASGRAEGFALVEALASLVIVSMISMMLFQGVGVGKRVWERVDHNASSAEAIEGAQSILRNHFQQIFPATLYGGQEAEADIHGQADTLDFLAPAADAKRPAPLRRYRLELNVGRQLLLSSISDVFTPSDTGITQEVLLQGVQQIDIAYFGAAAPDFTRRWRNTWHDVPVPPELIRVRVAFAPGDTRQWPDLIVHPMVTIDSNCILSSATSRCRGRG